MLMSRTVKFALTFAAGALVALSAVVAAAPRMLIEEHQSAFAIDETVERLSDAAKAEGWTVAGVRKLDENIAKNGGPRLRPVRIVELCQPHYAGALLEEDENGRLSAMMPCTISVYEKSDGRAYVAAFNVSLLGPLLGGKAANVFEKSVAPDQEAILRSVRTAPPLRGDRSQ